MSQLHFPFFPEGSTNITAVLAFAKQDGRITYSTGGLPVFTHGEQDLATFRMITAQFCENGYAKQSQIADAFGIPRITVKRAVKLFREKGVAGFYAQKKTRGPGVLIEEVQQNAQKLLDEGQTIAQVAIQLGLLKDTLAKAVRSGRLHVPIKINPAEVDVISTKSTRTSEDSAAQMGVGATNVPARLAASIGLLGSVAPQFKSQTSDPEDFAQIPI